MSQGTGGERGDLLAELNDLLALDRDAVQAYTMAIDQLRDGALRGTLMDYRSDHQRHVEALTRLIEAHGGTASRLPHLSTGPFKLAVQALGSFGDDRATLLAFKANEAQVRDKYRRHADNPHPADVTDVLKRAAADEERHYEWVARALETLGAGEGSVAGTAERVFEQLHGTTADILEGVERRLRG